MPDGDGSRGGSYYDQDGVLGRYLAHRRAPVTSPNLVMEEPALLAAAGELRDQRILDLGCGDGAFGAHCAAAGCRSYLGIDGSAAMIAEATAGEHGPAVRFQRSDLEDLVLPSNRFDLITSRLALHYVADVDRVMRTAAGALSPSGRLIVTVVHPVASAWPGQHDGPRHEQVVRDYFADGPRTLEWFGRPVRWYHRPVENYVDAVLGAGLRLDALRECRPEPERFDGDEAELARRRQVPLFLLLVGSKMP